MGLALGFAAVSCSESVEYTPAEAVAGGQVFFPSTTTDVTLYDLEEGKGSFTVEVKRAVTKGDLDVAVTLEQEGEHTPLVAPATVSFKDGEEIATLEIAYDSEGMEYEEQVAAVLTISDKANVTPYGVSTYEFAAAIPAPWTPWFSTKAAWVKAGYDPEAWPLSESNSTCTYTYVNYWGGDDTGLTIYYRQYMLDPTVGQFKIEHWGADSDFFIEYNTVTHNCQVLPQYVTDNANYGPVTVADVSHWQGADYYASYPCTYDPESGRFSLCVAYFVSAGSFGYDPETIQVDGFYVPDYSVSVEFDGVLTDKNQNVFAQVFADWGADVESVKAYVAQKSDDASAVADALAAGDVEGFDVVKGINKLPVNDLTGELKVVLAAIAGAEAVGVAEANFEYYGGGAASPWKSLGMGLYTEGLVADMYGIQSLTYEVEIKESTEKPGLYRIMDPYGEAWGYASANKSTPCDYLEVNACDPEGVYIEPQMIGVNLDGTELGMASMGGYYLANGNSFEDVKEYGYMGTLKDGVITLPTFTAGEGDDAYDFQGICIYGDKAYRSLVGFKVVLPEAVGAASVKKSAKANLGKPGKVRNSHMIDRKAKKVNPFLSVKSFRK